MQVVWILLARRVPLLWLKMKSVAEISLAPELTVAGRGGDTVLVSCLLLTINMVTGRLSESSVLTDDLLKRKRNGGKGGKRRED